MITPLALSFFLGTWYFAIMEAKIDKDANCSYLASPVTDFYAFVVGFYLIHEGFKTNNSTITIIGATLVTEHIWQFIYHKGVPQIRQS